MKKNIAMIILVWLLAAFFGVVGFTKGKTASERQYSQTCIVVCTNKANDIVTISTATGILYQFYGIEDNMVGDLLTVTFDSNGTDNVTDDAIINYTYSGNLEQMEFAMLEWVEHEVE